MKSYNWKPCDQHYKASGEVDTKEKRKKNKGVIQSTENLLS